MAGPSRICQLSFSQENVCTPTVCKDSPTQATKTSPEVLQALQITTVVSESIALHHEGDHPSPGAADHPKKSWTRQRLHVRPDLAPPFPRLTRLAALPCPALRSHEDGLEKHHVETPGQMPKTVILPPNPRKFRRSLAKKEQRLYNQFLCTSLGLVQEVLSWMW